MKHQYVPILRWKRGEQVALRQLSAPGKVDVVPLIVLQPQQYKIKKETRNSAEASSADVFSETILNSWGRQPIYIDATALPDKPNGQHPLEDICASGRVRGLDLMPCTKLSASSAYRKAVIAANQKDKAGVALRVDLGDLANASTWVGQWYVPVVETDLIADIGSNARVIYQIIQQVVATFQALHQANQWRTVTAAGTSMPPDFSGLTQGVHLITRFEKLIWQSISNGVAYKLDYGDYTTVSAGAVDKDIPWGYPINVKYTLSDYFLICKGVSPTGLNGIDMDVQLVQHAKTIVSHPQRNALSHCWADSQIDAVAGGSIKPSNLATWVQYSVNRHIEIVRSILP